jgi:hypothetical protein
LPDDSWMSALCQKWTSHYLLDHLIRQLLELRGRVDAQYLCGLEVITR